MLVTGAHTTDGASSALPVHKDEYCGFSVFVGSGEKFEGTVSVERSRDGGASFQPARATDDVELRFTGVAGAELENTIKSGQALNDSSDVELFRVRAEGIAQDGVSFRIYRNPGTRERAVLLSPEGEGLIFERPNGSLVAELANLPGAYDRQVSNGSTATALGLDVYETKITSGGSAGNESVTIGTGTGVTPGHRKLVTLQTRTHASDVIVLDHANIVNAAGAALSAATIATAGGFVLLEWNGAKWQVVYSANATLTAA